MSRESYLAAERAREETRNLPMSDDQLLMAWIKISDAQILRQISEDEASNEIRRHVLVLRQQRRAA